jgi:MFS family permease
MGNQMLAVAVGWQMYALTGSPFYLGLVGLAQFLPMVLLTFFVGQAADRYDRRRILWLCQLVQAVGVLTLAIENHVGGLNKESLLAIVFLIGAARSFEMPAGQALLPNLVSPALFTRAIAWSASLIQSAFIAGPALGGFLYAAGATTAYCAIGILLLSASWLISFVKASIETKSREPIGPESLFAGIAFIRSRPDILGAISLDLFAVLLGGATALLPIYAREILFVGPMGLGLLRSAPAMGALLMSLFLAGRPIRHHMGRIMFTSVIFFGASTMGFALSTSFILSLALLAFLGAADVVSVVIRQSLVQIRTPDTMRGRVSAINSIFIGTSNQLGEFESGLTAALFGAVPAVFLGGLGTVAVTLLWMRLFPELRRADRLDEAGREFD